MRSFGPRCCGERGGIYGIQLGALHIAIIAVVRWVPPLALRRVCAVAHGARRGAGALGGARDREARHVQALPRAHAARLPDF